MYLPREIAELITDFLVRKRYKPASSILPWRYTYLWSNKRMTEFLVTNGVEMNIYSIARNESDHAAPYIEEAIECINKRGDLSSSMVEYDFYAKLSANRKHFAIILKYPENIVWYKISSNVGAIDFLERHLDYADWFELSRNPAAIRIIENNLSEVPWFSLCDVNDAAIRIIEANPKRIMWQYLSVNPGAIHLLMANPEKIVNNKFSQNTAAIDILSNNLCDVSWYFLSKNKASASIIEANPKRIVWGIVYSSDIADLLLANISKISFGDLNLSEYGHQECRVARTLAVKKYASFLIKIDFARI